MSAPTIALMPYPAVPANGVFTGSTTEYWAQAQAVQSAQDAQARQEHYQLQREEAARIQMRKRQRVFTWMYNALAIGELVYFIVGLYMIEWQVADLQDNPLLGPGQEGIIKMGGTYTPRIIQRRQYWRLISSLFHNAGAIHLTSNMGMVWTFGHFLVREISPWLVALMFFAAGLAGLLVSVNIGADFSTAGASIPAFALAGAATAMLLFRWRRFTCHFASAAVVGFIVGANAFIGATPFVDNSGNTAGFVFGAVICLGIMMVRREKTDTKVGGVLVYVIAVGAVAALLAAIVGGLAGLQLDTPIAGCCDVWVCTPSSLWRCNASRINICTLTTYVNDTPILTCPQGNKFAVSLGSGSTAGDVQALCESLCSTGANMVSSGGGSSGYPDTSQR
ncbi:hypothetical protein Vretimale_3148 [Volvox reticuliferus]|uniref:RHOMBOID-like protein n=2 Tax=Volvox reticuliferus TaxID=1737510 RepID=A0A8J4C7W6_9CHLO|nr:hypothetical protein Vretifemale_6597 [Volvox reticuliferus]GIL97482.1 hypothetical protein Vretimale_3148 [Volvox reticuliferus]